MKKYGFRANLQKSAAVALLTAFMAGNLSTPAKADQYFDYGLKMFQARNYKAAAQYFDVRLKSNPNDSYAQYYRGLCYHVGGQLDLAKGLYQNVLASGTDANIKALAQKQLSIIEKVQAPATASIQNSSNSAGSPSRVPATSKPDGAPDDSDYRTTPTVVPQNARAYFTITPGGNDMIVEGKINGRNLHFKFDTGAHNVFLGKNHLQSLGIPVPTGSATGKASGVGGEVDTWTVKAKVTLAGITKVIPLCVTEYYENEPLLGQMFFEDLEYEIDNKGHVIYFRNPQVIAAGAKPDQYSIPFRKKGKHLVVALEGSNGKKTDILVDTGAFSVTFSKKNVQDLDIDIPADAEIAHFTGVGGASQGHKFVVDELRLGPIIMRHIPVIVDTGGKGAIGLESAKEGLLGQEFFSSWRFAIDNKNQRLRFFH